MLGGEEGSGIQQGLGMYSKGFCVPWGVGLGSGHESPP